MGQALSYTAPNENLVTGRIAELRPSQVQVASSISPTARHHERLGNAFHNGVLVDLSLRISLAQRCAIGFTVQRAHSTRNQTKQDPRRDGYAREGHR